jgi:hypothetical protein
LVNGVCVASEEIHRRLRSGDGRGDFLSPIVRLFEGFGREETEIREGTRR